MPKIPSPVFGGAGAPASASALAGLVSMGSASGAYTDKLRQYVIFELANVRDHSTSVPQATPTFPYMVMHANPETFELQYQKIISPMATRGGFVEQHWGEELDSISCSGSTGAFISIRSGLSVLNRKASIAYRKYMELVALYRNSGLVYDRRGTVIYRGGVNLHFDSNVHYGYFENLTVTEDDSKPFTFQVDFTFKVEHSHMKMGG